MVDAYLVYVIYNGRCILSICYMHMKYLHNVPVCNKYMHSY